MLFRSVAIHKINAPAGKAPFGAANARGQRQYTTSAFVKEALDKGAEIFSWEEKKARSGKRVGNKVPHPAILFLWLCVGVIVLSVLPGVIAWLKERRRGKGA